ncbi:MAG: hypothetical protein ACLP1Y_12615 [Candidatus Acidiferrales bacterium]
MRVECGWCHRHLGDTCDRCGTDRVQMPWPSVFGFCTNRLRCLACGYRFDRFNCGVTDGICAPCRRARFPQFDKGPRYFLCDACLRTFSTQQNDVLARSHLHVHGESQGISWQLCDECHAAATQTPEKGGHQQ